MDRGASRLVAPPGPTPEPDGTNGPATCSCSGCPAWTRRRDARTRTGRPRRTRCRAPIRWWGTPGGGHRHLPHETLLVHGREDRIIPLASSLRLHELIPASQLHVFGHCGHWTQIERRADFVRLLQDFLPA
ncbi:alpha/beta fold hydrolase [Pseudonocardia alni]|uniref:Alpha/beta fold hydrolase n=1 Tax=Pseudonocardia alni subsp. carboxydivorans TaxID=415010 RepID=A0ABU9AJA6_PSEA5